MRRRRRSPKLAPMLPRLLSLTVALVLLGAAPALADSIAYVKDGDVWLAAPDGSRTLQVTHTGGYSYVSQADTGEMIALAPGERLRKLSRTGKVLAEFHDDRQRRRAAGRAGQQVPRPVQPARSRPTAPRSRSSGSTTPTRKEQRLPRTPRCRRATSTTKSQGVAISSADRYTGPEAYGLLTGWIYPQWTSNDTLLRSYSGATIERRRGVHARRPGPRRHAARPVVLRRQAGPTASTTSSSRVT